ncbi:hypothetical protein ABZ612_06220 [Streptomyces avermitilis]|uniref:hypothetical protein n=1 Tax=Streptomyces avermitilis TaxID=33903 RepID=UPI0033C1D489
MARSEVERRLGLHSVDEDELRDLLIRTIGSAKSSTMTRLELPYEGPVTLALIYDKRGRLNAIEPGPGWTEELAASLQGEVASKLQSPPVPRVRVMGLYAAHPVAGYWRYKDKMVVREVPSTLPQAPMLSADHPLICEIAYEGSDDGVVDMARADRESRQLILLLTLLVRGLTLPNHHQSRKAWAYLPPFKANEPLGRPESHSGYVQLGYNLNGIPARTDALSEQGDATVMPTAAVPPEYISHDLTLTLPESLADDLDGFFDLTPNDRRRLLRSAYWLHHSRQVFYYSKSAAYTALVQSVEVLLDPSPEQSQCPDCQRAMGPGPTRLFMDFINRYAPARTAAERSMHRDAYRIRSKITHGDHLFVLDEETGFMSSQTHVLELEQLGHAQKVCRAAVIAWLRERASE